MSRRDDFRAQRRVVVARNAPSGADRQRVSTPCYNRKIFLVRAMAKRAARAYTFSTREKHHMRILIADDHPIVRHGLKQMLAADPSATIVGEATNGDEALALARKLEWDMAIFDFTMPGPQRPRPARRHEEGVPRPPGADPQHALRGRARLARAARRRRRLHHQGQRAAGAGDRGAQGGERRQVRLRLARRDPGLANARAIRRRRCTRSSPTASTA